MICELENIAVYYETFGEGRPILMLHGWSGDHRLIMGDMEPLFMHRDGWKRIYPDLPGMGQTPGPDWITNGDHMLDVILAFIDKIFSGEHFAVAGISYGGYLARGVVYWRSSSIDGVMLNVPRHVYANRILPPKRALVENAAILSELEATGFADMVVIQSRKMVEIIKSDLVPAVQMADHAFLSNLDPNLDFSYDVDKLPEPFAKPSLILTGRQDHVQGYQTSWSILENYPRATFAVLDGAGHLLRGEQEELFCALANEWLDRVEVSTSA
ncbi:MAG TPA: alpha/beta hydrolase [Aggregatilineales bacterium]|nr:alpha/beta hydrolase [Aggregatilineales bacterium]